MPYTVMRTAAGSPVAPSVIRALQALPEVRVVAVDIDPHACGFAFADAHAVVPRVAAPDYLEAMLAVCRAESVDLLFPDLDEELLRLAEHRAAFEAVGTRVLVSPPEALRPCLDKFATYRFFEAHGIPTPPTFLPDDLPDDLPWPLLVKPRSGRGSRHVFRIETRRELDFFLDYVERPLVQAFIDGTEYTVDTLSDLGGAMRYCSIRERIATDSGISTQGRVVDHAEVERWVRHIVEALGLVGPGCVQVIEEAAGDLFFLEINPRIAGSAVLSMQAGAPLVADAVRLMCGQPIQGPAGFRPGTRMMRYWAEIYADDAG